jgi:hypothetical protein
MIAVPPLAYVIGLACLRDVNWQMRKALAYMVADRPAAPPGLTGLVA